MDIPAKPWPTGLSEQCEPLVRRVLAPNASHYTFTGTQTYLVGAGDEVAVIDPGPADSGDASDPTPFKGADTNGAGHVEAILAAVGPAKIAAILCTHTHRDHSPAAAVLKAATGAPIIGCAPLVISDDGPRADSAFDRSYAPDRVLADGERLAGPGWTIEAVATPGHTSNHLCYSLVESGALFTGDHVMAWSTSVSAPPMAIWPPIWPALKSSMPAKTGSFTRRTVRRSTRPGSWCAACWATAASARRRSCACSNKARGSFLTWSPRCTKGSIRG